MPINVQCKRCANLKHGWCALKVDSPDPEMVRDCERFRARTNHDNILDMSREQLADFLENDAFEKPWCDPNAEIDPETKECKRWDCVKCALDWLQQEVDNGNPD